jgi:hypothetical protein
LRVLTFLAVIPTPSPTQINDTGDGRRYVLRASDVGQLNEWVTAIRDVIAALQG